MVERHEIYMKVQICGAKSNIGLRLRISKGIKLDRKTHKNIKNEGGGVHKTQRLMKERNRQKHTCILEDIHS
jgi:hypothetical protein